MENRPEGQPADLEQSQEPAYVPPSVEDLDTSRGPAVTAAGKGTGISPSSPRTL